MIFIVGNGRSGTSVFSRWLTECGVDFGDNLRGNHAHMNPVTNGEDEGIRRFHSWLLRHNHQPNSFFLDPTREYTVPSGAHKRAEDLVKGIQHRDDYAIKEPLATLFLSLWSDVVPDGKYILVYRHYSSVVDSILRLRHRLQHHRRNRIAGGLNELWYRFGFVNEERLANLALQMWIRMNRDALRFQDSGHYSAMTVLRTDQAFGNDRALCNALNRTLNLNLQFRRIDTVREPGRFHSSAPSRSFDPLLVTEADEMWTQLTERTIQVI